MRQPRKSREITSIPRRQYVLQIPRSELLGIQLTQLASSPPLKSPWQPHRFGHLGSSITLFNEKTR